MLFSQRKQLKPIQKAIQIESIDEELRNGLWSVFHSLVLRAFQPQSGGSQALDGSNLHPLFAKYWIYYFKWPVDQMPWDFETAAGQVRRWFFAAPWNEVYDFIEFTAGHAADSDDLKATWNSMMEIESAGYRFVGDQIVDVIDKSEIDSIETAVASPISTVREHITRALSLLSDRKQHDYRNSVKESISAVEALCRLIVKKENATLGEAVAILEKSTDMHPAFMKALTQLYGYTSDKSGIRHALLDAPEVRDADARFMLVVCSAFVNYVAANADSAGIKLS
jgi:hypothetical protein